MSLSWRETVRIALCRDRVILARLGGWRGNAVVARHIQRCDGAPRGDWRPALQAVADALKQRNWRGARATVVLSNEFVRYQAVPWNDQLGDENERAAYARHCFEQVHGGAVGAWDLRLCQEHYGAAGIASAVDRELVQSLEATFKALRFELASVQPYLMAAFNQWRHLIAGQSFCFVLAERARWCLALSRGRDWLGIRNVPVDDDAGDGAMPALLEREFCLAGIEPSHCGVFLHAPERPALGAALEHAGKWRVRLLQPERDPYRASPTDALYAMAIHP